MASGDKTNIAAIKDLTGATQAMAGKTSGVPVFVGQQAVLLEPIADGDYVISAGDTITTVNGIITAITPA